MEKKELLKLVDRNTKEVVSVLYTNGEHSGFGDDVIVWSRFITLYHVITAKERSNFSDFLKSIGVSTSQFHEWLVSEGIGVAPYLSSKSGDA